MKNYGVLYNQKFDITHTIDEQLRDPNTKIKFGNNEYSLAEINNLVPSQEKKIDMFIEWDNMCQYNAIGLVKVLNGLIEENRKLNLGEFVRRNEYPNGFDYVKKVIFPDIDSSLIDQTIQKYYAEIMAASPLTDFFTKINLMKFMLNSVTFMFRYDIKGLDNFVKEISNNKFNSELYCKYSIYPDEETEIRAIKEFPLKDIYIVPDMGLYYKAIMDAKKTDTTILSYKDHNGMNPYILAYYINEFEMNDIPGPNNVILNFLQEYKIKDSDIERYKETND